MQWGIHFFRATSRQLQEQISLAKANIRQHPNDPLQDENDVYHDHDTDYIIAENTLDNISPVSDNTIEATPEETHDLSFEANTTSSPLIWWDLSETSWPSFGEEQQTNNQALSWYSAKELAQTVEDIKYAALTYKERWKKDEYEKKLIEGIALVGDHEEFLIMLADHYFEAGQYVRAATLLKKIIHINPENHRAIWQLWQIYAHDKDRETAKLLLEKARDLKDDNPKYLISLVEMYYEEKNMRECILLVEKLSKLRPTNIDYLLTLGNLHEEINQPTKAHSYYMKVLELNPTNDEAKKAIKRLL